MREDIPEIRGQGSEVSTNDFDYNARSELTDADMGSDVYDYSYDLIGNRIQMTEDGSQTTDYAANSLNQYTNITGTATNTPTYDADGNLLTYNGWTFSWNGGNRLIQASNATTVVTFKYDSQGRRFEKTVNATNTTRFVYDGWNLVQSTTMSNDVVISTNSYVWGIDLSGTLQGAGGVGGLLSVIKGGANSPSEPFFPTYDANGNITDYVTTNGTIAAHFEYDPYGNITAEAISTNLTGLTPSTFSHRFSTKYWDAETQLSYYGFRYYNPEMGRWLNRDPIEERGGLGLYSYCANYPCGKVDYLGLVDSMDTAYNVGSSVAPVTPAGGLVLGGLGYLKGEGEWGSFSRSYTDTSSGWMGKEPIEKNLRNTSCSSEGAKATGLTSCGQWVRSEGSSNESEVGKIQHFTLTRTKTCYEQVCTCRCSTGAKKGLYYMCNLGAAKVYTQTKQVTKTYY